jgi:outer membrane protein assembly factor BamA
MKLLPAAHFFLIIATTLLLSACGGSEKLTQTRYKVKNYPKEKPIVYYNKIEINNKELNKEEKTLLNSSLTTQLNDSMQVKVKESFLVFKKLVDPAVFDSIYAAESARNMEIYLKTIGYYYGAVTHQSVIDTFYADKPQKKEIRAATVFTVNTGPLVKIDSVNFLLFDSLFEKQTNALQQLADANRDKSLIKKGEPFTEELILNELERLVDLYRNNGYYKFSREHLIAEADSFYLPLLNPMLDPFERIRVLREAQKRKTEPVFNVFIRLRPINDSTVIMPYLNGTVTVFPEYTNAAYDTTLYQKIEYERIFIQAKQNRFKPSFINSHIYLRPGNVYKLTELNRTLDELNSLGTWQLIKVEPVEKLNGLSASKDTGQIDFNFRLVPFKRYTFSADLEGVFNQVQQAAVGVAGNLIGFGLNLGIRNRNFLHRGIQFSNTLRFGVESGIGSFNPGLQAIELTYSSSLSIPKLVFIKSGIQNKFNQKRSFVTATASYIDRNINANGLYSLNNINISAGWQASISKPVSATTFTLQPINVEFVKLYDLSQPFQDTLNRNTFLRFSFQQGLVMGLAGSLLQTRKLSESKTTYIRFSFEESGLTWGRTLRSISSVKNQLFTYIKSEIEFKYSKVNANKTTWVLRTLVGGGYNFSDTASMPFFKQFTGGGPNSMRGWPLRSIGPGSRPLDPRGGSRGQFFSRSGDFIFEANAEYRYNIYTIIPNTAVVRGALFTDVGNVWNFKNRSNLGNDTVILKLKDFYRELGVSAGTGIRLDFVGLFVIRLDFALRIKNPSLPFSAKNNGWRFPGVSFKNIFSANEENRQWRYENFNFSIGINYPF